MTTLDRQALPNDIIAGIQERIDAQKLDQRTFADLIGSIEKFFRTEMEPVLNSMRTDLSRYPMTNEEILKLVQSIVVANTNSDLEKIELPQTIESTKPPLYGGEALFLFTSGGSMTSPVEVAVTLSRHANDKSSYIVKIYKYSETK